MPPLPSLFRRDLGGSRSHFVNSGAEAVENAVKIAPIGQWPDSVSFRQRIPRRTLRRFEMTAKVKP